MASTFLPTIDFGPLDPHCESHPLCMFLIKKYDLPIVKSDLNKAMTIVTNDLHLRLGATVNMEILL